MRSGFRYVAEPRPGTARDGKDPVAIAREWRAMAEAKSLSLRQVAIETSERSGFVGTPGQVADELARWVRAGATDGFNISPYIVPGGLDEIVDWWCPNSRNAAYTGLSTRRRPCGLTWDFVNR